MTEKETYKDNTDVPDEGAVEESEAETEDKAVDQDTAEEPAAEAKEEVPSEEAEEEPVEAEAEVEEEAEEEKEEEGEEAGEEEEEETISGFDKVAALTDKAIRTDLPDFRPGDTVRVHVKIIEGSKERIQVFEGVVIALKHGGMDRTFTVRKTSWGVGVERTFFLNSTKIDRIELVRRGRVRRAKLYYLRQRAGKSARIKERRMQQPKE